MKVGEATSVEMFARNSKTKLIQILEFPVLFLGAKPSDTPSFYSFMNYADFGWNLAPKNRNV
jgi:phytoene desaturase